MIDKKLKKIMNPNPVVANKDTLVFDALSAMHEKKIGAVVVTEKTKVIGIFTERDLVRICAKKEFDYHSTKLSQVMTKKVKKVDEDTDLEDALMILTTNNIRHLPIVNQNENLTGILSLKDITGEVLETILKARN